ncbi:hypothetical protein [Cryptosporangium sp. NPDC048952]|uniref:hypothetical protein n=1 Tax=Cryptosporangium sp. NPDC048952 TaxID=3363961 RepID=UPI00371F9AB0
MTVLGLSADWWEALGGMLGGIGSVAAFFTGLVLISRESKARRSAEEIRQSVRRDEEARQARLIRVRFGEVCPTRVPCGMSELGTTWTDGVEVTGELFNFSEAPVFDVTAGIDGARQPVQRAMLGPTQSVAVRWELIGVEAEALLAASVQSGAPGARTPVRLEFCDTYGRAWQRRGEILSRRTVIQPALPPE